MIYDPYNEKTMAIIKSDLKEMKSDARKIIRVLEKCEKLVNNPPVDGKEWTNLMAKIRKLDRFEYIIMKKRGRF